MKILLCTPPPGYSGGISRWSEHILNYYQAIDKKDIDVELFPLPRKKAGSFSLFRRLFTGLFEYCVIIYNFWKRIRKRNSEIIHLVSSASISLVKDLIIILIAEKYNNKSIVHFRFGRIPEIIKSRNWEYFLLKLVIKKSTKVIVIDSTSFDALKILGYNNIEFLPNPLSKELLDLIDKYNDVKRIKGNILFAGQMLQTKGIFELIKACSRISDIKLIMLGLIDSKTLALIKSYLEVNQIDSSFISIKGNVNYEEVVLQMKSCNVFTLPSYTEGFPNVILESMACSCPIVATKVGAIPEMCENRKTGLLIEPKNVDQLENALRFMLENDSFANQCGHEAHQKVITEYMIDNIWSKMESIWLSSLS